MSLFFDLPTWKGFAFLGINALKYRESPVDSLPKGIGDASAPLVEVSTSTCPQWTHCRKALVTYLPWVALRKLRNSCPQWTHCRKALVTLVMRECSIDIGFWSPVDSLPKGIGD